MVNSDSVIRLENREGYSIYFLKGRYTKKTIPHYLAMIEQEFKREAPQIIDLSEIERCDSALVALLVQFKRDYPNLSYQKMTNELHALIDIYGISTYL